MVLDAALQVAVRLIAVKHDIESVGLQVNLA